MACKVCRDFGGENRIRQNLIPVITRSLPARPAICLAACKSQKKSDMEKRRSHLIHPA
jgi:hypothetical protein